jgi:hypothetical protein
MNGISEGKGFARRTAERGKEAKGSTQLPNFPNYQIFGRGILTGKHEIMKYMKKAGEEFLRELTEFFAKNYGFHSRTPLVPG